MSRNFSIVTATNTAYLNPLKVMLYSLHENMAGESPRVFVLIREELENVVDDLQRWCDSQLPRMDLKPVIVSESLVAKIDRSVNCTSYQSLESWYRLFLFDLVENLAENIVYLDVDMVVQGNLNHLLETFEASGSNFSAVEDSFLSLKKPGDNDYFNCGLLLFKNNPYNESRFRNAWSFANNNPDLCPYFDQSALNQAYNGNWHHLEPAWNFQTGMITRKRYHHVKPAIIHYTCESKPWHLACKHPYKADFHGYARSAGLNLFQRYNFAITWRNRLQDAAMLLTCSSSNGGDSFIEKAATGGRAFYGRKKYTD